MVLNFMQVTQLELSPNEEERNFFLELELQDKEETQEDNPQQRESPMQEDESQGEDEEEQETQALDSQLPISLDKLSKEELLNKHEQFVEKVHWCTVYVLQLSQENEELKEQNAKLCAENSNLKDEIMKLQDEKKSITSKLLAQIKQYEENNKQLSIAMQWEGANQQIDKEQYAKATIKAKRDEKEITNMDGISSPVAKKQKKLHILKFPKNAEVLEQLEEEDRIKLRTMIETEVARWKLLHYIQSSCFSLEIFELISS